MAITLASVLIMSLVAQTLGAKVKQIIPVKRTAKLDLEHLIDAISVEIPGTQGLQSAHSGIFDETQEAPKVAKLLAKTAPKNVVHPLLKFSIDDLLNLNEWTVDDCNDAELAKRRDMCSQFFEEGRFEGGTRYLVRPKKNDFVHYNLGKFCWKVVHELQSKCPAERLEQALVAVDDSLGLKGEWLLLSLFDDVKRHISKNEVPANHWEYYQKAVEQVFDASSNKDKLKKICLNLVAKLKEFYEAKMLSNKWSTRFRECSIINDIQVVN